MRQTPYLNIDLPEYPDGADIEVLNAGTEKIDARIELHEQLYLTFEPLKTLAAWTTPAL